MCIHPMRSESSRRETLVFIFTIPLPKYAISYSILVEKTQLKICSTEVSNGLQILNRHIKDALHLEKRENSFRGHTPAEINIEYHDETKLEQSSQQSVLENEELRELNSNTTSPFST